MTNKYCNLDGAKKIKDEFNKITEGFNKVESDMVDIIVTPAEGVSEQEIIQARKGKATLGNKIDDIDSNINTVNNSLSSNISGVSSQLNDRIDNIIATPTTVSEQEIIDARQGNASLGQNISLLKEDYLTKTNELFKDVYEFKKEPIKLNDSELWEIGHVDGVVGEFTTWEEGKMNTNVVRLRTIKPHTILKGAYEAYMLSDAFYYSIRIFDLETGEILQNIDLKKGKTNFELDRDCLLGFQLRRVDNTNIYPSDAFNSGLSIWNIGVIEQEQSNVFFNIKDTLPLLIDDVIESIPLSPQLFVYGSFNKEIPYKEQPDVSMKRFRFDKLKLLDGKRKVEFNSSEYNVSAIVYNTDGSFSLDSGWQDISGYLINRTDDYKISVLLMRKDNGDMTYDDIVNANIKIVNMNSLQKKIENISNEKNIENNIVKRLNNNQSEIVRVGTWNIAYSQLKYVEASETIMEEGLNFIGIQEYRGGLNEGIIKTYANKTLPNYYYSQSVSNLGTLALTNFHKISEESIPLELYGGTEQRVLNKIVVYIKGKKVSIYTAHLDYTPHTATTSQIADVINLLNSDTNDYKIVVGDFNPDYNSDFDPFVTAGYKICNGKDGVWFETFKTLIGSGYTQSLDNIIVSANIDIIDVKMVVSDDLVSDHNMLYADLIFN